MHFKIYLVPLACCSRSSIAGRLSGHVHYTLSQTRLAQSPAIPNQHRISSPPPRFVPLPPTTLIHPSLSLSLQSRNIRDHIVLVNFEQRRRDSKFRARLRFSTRPPISTTHRMRVCIASSSTLARHQPSTSPLGATPLLLLLRYPHHHVLLRDSPVEDGPAGASMALGQLGAEAVEEPHSTSQRQGQRRGHCCTKSSTYGSSTEWSALAWCGPNLQSKSALFTG
jgi:hypothetical protein